jgi:hypothetical protein
MAGESAVRTGLLGQLLALAHGVECLPCSVVAALEQQARERRKRQAQELLHTVRKTSARERVSVQEAFEDGEAQARGAAAAMQQVSHDVLAQRAQFLSQQEQEGREVQLEVASQEHSGRITAIARQLQERLAAAAAALQRKVDALDVQESAAAELFEHQMSSRDDPLDYLRFENPPLQLRLHRCKSSMNVSTHGIFSQHALSPYPNSHAALASAVKGCVVVLEEEEERLVRSLELQAAGAAAVIYTSVSEEDSKGLPQREGQQRMLPLPTHGLKIPVARLECSSSELVPLSCSLPLSSFFSLCS